MNKNQIKDVYIKAAMESLLFRHIEFCLPVGVSPEDALAFRQKLNSELVKMEESAEIYAESACFGVK